jgi:hypothetical protein
MKKEVIALMIVLAFIFLPTVLDDLAYNSKVDGLYQNVLSNFSEMRGYPLAENVSIKVVTKDWVLQRWGATRVEEEVPDYLENEELFLKTLMLVKKNFSYYKRKNEEVGGFMAFSWKGDIYVVKENFNPESPNAGEAIVHELEHIIQEKYFDIEDDGTFDGEKATGAIIEGDAVLAGRLYAGKNLSDMQEYEVDEDNCLNFIYMFPYHYGIRYLSRIYEKEGYAGVDEALRNPPMTTEQILHSNYEFFEDVENEVYAGNLIKKERLGELMVFTFLAAHLNDSIAREAAHGWNGDSYVLYRNSGFVWEWKILFDSFEDADEFYNVFEKMMGDLGNYSKGEWSVSEDYINQTLTVEVNGLEVKIKGEGL